MSDSRRRTRSSHRGDFSSLDEVSEKKIKKTTAALTSKPKSKPKTKPGSKTETVFVDEKQCSSTFLEDDDEQQIKYGALKGRSQEFESLMNWILESKRNKKSVSIYMSGQPGTGKTATMKKVLESLNKSVKSCIVNCASTNTKSALLSQIFNCLNFQGRATQENFEKQVSQLQTSIVLVLDEIDHLVSRTNSTLYSAFRWPYSLSYKIIIIGIANSIDLTERLLPKLMLSEPPKRLIFEPYTKDSIVEILTDKMKTEREIDKKAVELCARKVAAMSGDLRTALHIFKQTRHRVFAEETKVGAGDSAPSKNGCREVLGVINSVYSSPLARARLPFQPRILLAVCLALSSSKKAKFNRDSLIDAYSKTCNAIRAPQMDEEDLMVAFQTLESQSFIRQLNGGKMVLQVDSATARAAISDNSMLDQIALLNF